MCGIAGIKYLNQDTGEKNKSQASLIVSSILEFQNSRGPDATGTWNNNKIFLGHNRLSIIDLSEAGTQPMESKNWVLTYNGEIYNFKEIKKDLISKGVTFVSTSDTEVLLLSLEHYGIHKTIEKINGMFSFGAYNKENDTLYLVRDRLGIKPLFYYIDEKENNIIFASSPGAIVKSLSPKKWDLNYDCVYTYFLLGAINSEDTFFKGIKRLDAACMLEISDSVQSIKNNKYWRPSPREENIEELLEDCLSKRLVSDVPLVLFLSGGVDSSVLAALASKIKNIDAIHLMSEEEKYAKLVAQKFDINLSTVDPGAYDLDASLRKYVASSGEPSMASMIPFVVSKEVTKYAKVAISANGADELFFGYPRTLTPNRNTGFFLKQGKNQDTSPSSKNKWEQLTHIFRNPYALNIPKSFISQQMIRLSNSGVYFKQNDGAFNNREFKIFENTGLGHMLGFNQEENYLNDNFEISAQTRWNEISTYIKYDLNPTLDFASMANSLEVRVPFLDHRLVEAALTLTDVEHITEEYSRKSILKRMLDKNKVDSRVWARPKIGFSLSPWAKNQISSRRSQAMADLYEREILNFPINAGNISARPHRDQTYLMNTAWSFEHWCKEWIDGGYINL